MCEYCDYESSSNEYYKDQLDGIWYQYLRTSEWDDYSDDFVYLRNYGCKFCQYCGRKLDE